ncbi:MAG TPA: hypothetical protein VNN07_01005 [Candidatus Tectomicrobia bacterium]|nr:hypothetical protein [Candidatus Tectomicrobia bacterium]
MEIRIEGRIDRAIPRGHVIERLRGALRRVPARRVRACVRFDDVNGPKGGNDIRCAIVVEVAGRPPLRVTRLAATPRLAFDAGYERLVRRLDDAAERRQEQRRHPKKHFAARRLL